MVSLLHPFLFVIFITLHPSNGVSDRYMACNSLHKPTCGNLTNIRYPFWGLGRPKYCGHPALELKCPRNSSDASPVLKLDQGDDVSFRVLSINTFDNIVIELKLLANRTCPLQLKNTSIQNVFKESFISVNFFYKCPQQVNSTLPSNDTHYSRCTDDNTNTVGFYVGNWSDIHKFDGCQSTKVSVPWELLDSVKRATQPIRLAEILKQHFPVEFSYSSNCHVCQESGGTCGSSDKSDFMCHCKNGSFHFVCKSGKWILIGSIVVPGCLLLLVALNIGFCCYIKKKNKKKNRNREPMLLTRMISSDPMNPELETDTSLHGIPVFPYSELQEATSNFSAAQELGDGGFGIVYYGKLRDGRDVAVKRLYEKNYKQVGNFLNEIKILTQLRHQHLVTLYGCTSRSSRDLLLVYEYVPNGTVADHLYGKLSVSKALTWETRMKIAIETAKALSYLHTSDIIHRDVKTNNILLDNSFSVKVADFGLSRFFPLDATHVTTTPQGTPGYLDPEYHKCYQVTNKSDVYSFGVVLVELISSLPAIDITRQDDEINLADYAMKRIQMGAVHQLIDQTLGSESDFKVKRMITLVAELAFQCLQQVKEVRPCMTTVLETLQRIRNLDYKVLEADEMDEINIKPKLTSTGADTDTEKKPPPSPSSVIDNWVMKSSASNSSC